MIVDAQKKQSVFFELNPLVNYDTDYDIYFKFLNMYHTYKVVNEDKGDYQHYEYWNDHTVYHAVKNGIHYFVQESRL